MTLTITLSDEQATTLRARAAAEGLCLEEWIQKLAEPEAAKNGQSQQVQIRRPIWEIFTENMKDVPPEDFAALPKDGLNQIDHYVYGVPKRTP